ncbi:unnamed protein product [Moneuplotes crassus]|uniref:Transcription initiation factor TFIID subunit 12 domain-containing protein n=1 Tax=Euplotes crassus TaxID=5936 RepID=A0AAD1Y1R7_EUPCR|nr:unnamed protein product [Moneuplotes crassus]
MAEVPQEKKKEVSAEPLLPVINEKGVRELLDPKNPIEEPSIRYNMDTDVCNFLIQMGEDYLEALMEMACKLTKRRDAEKIEVEDLILALRMLQPCDQKSEPSKTFADYPDPKE